MPLLKRPDGVEIHWRERGAGPPVVICSACFAHPGIFEPLIAELEPDHRVITYDARGDGESTRRGPYEMPTDAEDLVGLLEDGIGEPTLLVGTGDASHRVIHAAAARPELVSAVVSPGVTPLGAQADYSSVGEGLASSSEVVGALVQLLESDFRSGMRTAVEAANPQLDDERLRERLQTTIAYTSQEATLGRLRAWIADDARESARALGDRLWILYFPGNAWFPAELRETVSREAPEAHLEQVENGALSRPDITAGYIRRLTHC